MERKSRAMSAVESGAYGLGGDDDARRNVDNRPMPHMVVVVVVFCYAK